MSLSGAPARTVSCWLRSRRRTRSPRPRACRALRRATVVRDALVPRGPAPRAPHLHRLPRDVLRERRGDLELGRPDEESGRRLLARGRGCDSCGGSGHRGWAAVFEALPLTGEIRTALAEGAPTAAIHDAAREAGMSTLREAAVGLCLDGVTSVGEVRLVLLG